MGPTRDPMRVGSDPSALPPPRPLLVLVADARPEARDALVEGIARGGCLVAAAATGEEALARAIAIEPDLVVIDVLLPDLCGIEVARRLRADPRTRGAVVVALASHRPDEYRRLAVEVGCASLLDKPADPARLADLAASVLAPRSALQGAGGEA